MAGIQYSIQRNRIEEGYHPGFILREDEVLESIPGEVEHLLYLKAIDSAKEDSFWGSLRFQGEFDENMVCYIYVAARNEAYFYRENEPRKIERFLCDPKEPIQLKRRFMEQIKAKRVVNQEEILLYEQKGRYLYVFIEVMGEGRCTLRNIRIDGEGDNFMQTFPEVYQQRNSFFHRFLSIFSTIYNEFEERIEALPSMLDIDTCPKELLPVYAGWMGVELGGDFFDEAVLRKLVRRIYGLNRLKGTKAVLEELIEIILEEKPIILERNRMEDYIETEHREEFAKLYGDSVYDVTILINQELSEATKNQLMHMLNQYKPIRSNLYLVQLKQEGTLNAYSYLDMNAAIGEKKQANLDEQATMDGVIILQ